MHDAFLKAVIETPDDDAPRLVYADWLDDQGDEARADLIRAQCALARMPAGDPRRPDLEAHEKALLDAHGWEWAEPLGDRISEWMYRRGFIERVDMGLETADKILEAMTLAPIRHLRDTTPLFFDLTGLLGALPGLDGLTGLEVWNIASIHDEHLRQALASPHLGGLRTLVLHHDAGGSMANDEVIAEALLSPARSNTEALVVNTDSTGRGPSRRLLRTMAASPHLRNLRWLNFDGAGDETIEGLIDAATATALGESPNLAGLMQLDLGRASLTPMAWGEVLRWPLLGRLTWLRLHAAQEVRANRSRGTRVNRIADLPDYRYRFEERVKVVDWDTESITPGNGATCWHGQSWERLRQGHLFSIWPFVKKRDWDGLETAFRSDCLKHAGPEATAVIDALPFARYESDLSPSLRRALDTVVGIQDAHSVWLRIRPDMNWQGSFQVSNAPAENPFSPREEYGHFPPFATFPAPFFDEAGQAHERYPEGRRLDPGGARHYLIARTVAALGRCVARHRPEWSVYFSCMSAVFRVA